MIRLIAIFCCIFILGCKQEKSTEKSTFQEVNDATSSKAQLTKDQKQEAIGNLDKAGSFSIDQLMEDTLHVKFDLFTLSFPKLEAFDGGTVHKKDSIEIWLDLTSDFDAQTLQLSMKDSLRFDSILIYESYRTTLSIPNEGPHLDLYEWKGFESEWIALARKGANTFVTKELTEKETRQFPDFTKEELIEVANKYEGAWGELISNPTRGDWEESFWIGVGLRRLKIDLFNAGQKTTRILEVYIPMGC